MTACVTISKHKVEAIQFLHKVQRKAKDDEVLIKARGMTQEIFVQYLELLIKHLKMKYPRKTLII